MQPKKTQLLGYLLLGSILAAFPVSAQQGTTADVAVGLTLPVGSSAQEADTLLDPEAGAWQRFAARRLALNRTPPLYETDPPAVLEIPTVDVRVARSAGKLFIHMSWRDARSDTAALPATPNEPPERRDRKAQTAATSRFFDAAAVMFPAGQSGSMFTPSLQMGDPQHPVTIYYWNAARGSMLMQAHGRSTTHPTGESFPVQAVHRAGIWQVVLELPELPAGTPMAFAVWNGSQLDRDGRKYFSVWHWLQ